MSFSRLLETDHGKIVLINLCETIRADLVGDDLKKTLLAVMRSTLAKLPNDHSAEDLVKAIAAIVWSHQRYQLASTERPDEAIRLAAVRPYDDVVALLRKVQKLHISATIDDEIDAAIAEGAPVAAMERGIEILNSHTPNMPQLTIGGAYNVFWATTHEAMTESLQDATSAPHVLRNRLGLIHYNPSTWKGPLHLVAFEATAPVADFPAGAFRIARPTTLDGFDNPRFRQSLPARMTPEGCGSTVDITGGLFADGLPELVATEIPLQNWFTCRYLGRLLEPPQGRDEDFVNFLMGPAKLQDFVDTLDRLAS